MTKDEALKLALEALQKLSEESDCNIYLFTFGRWGGHVATESLQKALAQPVQEPHNFCPRCGKRTADLTTIHTCTPPEGGHQ